MKSIWVGLIALCLMWHCQAAAEFDVLIRQGTVYNGEGSAGRIADVGIRGDRIVLIGNAGAKRGAMEIDATGLAVTPGFINMLSWAGSRLIIDGKSQSDIRQGVTLEVMGEGVSGGPLSPAMQKAISDRQQDYTYPVSWNTLGGYLEFLQQRGVSCNIASYVGATTVRMHVLEEENRAPDPDELKRMQALVDEAMRDGALGMSSALIYAPGFYASTAELIALAEVVARYDGVYASHMRSEGNALMQATDEFLEIIGKSGARGEIFHLKAAGKANWPKLDAVIERVENARTAGLDVSANMYLYTAGSTGLDAAMPPWVQEGGYDAWQERLMQTDTRKRVLQEMRSPTDEWENLYLAAGAENVILIGFRNPDLRHLTGKRLSEVAKSRGQNPAETIVDLVIEDGSRVECVYFLMSESNVNRQVALRWVSFCSDAGSMAPEGVFLNESTHPRAYGNFARLLGKYVREQKMISLPEAIRKLTSMPAKKLRLQQRGKLAKGYFADIAIFDPAEIQDHATYEEPHQFATGMQHVFVNGTPVLLDGEHTGALPGRVVRGPGWQAPSQR